MTLAAQFSALYRLYYKRAERESFLRGGPAPVQGLSDAELHQLRALEPARLRRVVDLHAGDIAGQWYRPRVPATWLALQAALEIPQAELVHRLTESPVFEDRDNDDADARALAAFVRSMPRELAATPWVSDLLAYERLLGCPWDDGPNPRVVDFGFDVPAIRQSLLQDGLCPLEEPRRKTSLLLFRGHEGVNEIALRRHDADAARALLAGARNDGSAAFRRADKMLRDIRC